MNFRLRKILSKKISYNKNLNEFVAYITPVEAIYVIDVMKFALHIHNNYQYKDFLRFKKEGDCRQCQCYFYNDNIHDEIKYKKETIL